MIRGLPVYILEQDIIDNILTHGIEPKEVRLIRKKDTGESRGFAFVEFESVDDATEWIDAEQGMLQFGTWQISMQYSQARHEDSKVIEITKLQVDWNCPKCDVQNFKRREKCFKCGGGRPEIDLTNTILEEEEDESSPHPSQVLLLTNLDTLTTEDTLYGVLTPLSKAPIASIVVARDKLTKMSRGVSYVTMNSIVDSMLLFRKLQEDSIEIDGKKLIVAYKRPDKSSEPDIIEVEVEKPPSQADMEADRANNDGGARQSSKAKCMVNFSEEEIRKMAEFSADLYAKHPTERARFIEYYTTYYKEGGDPTPALKAIYGGNNSAAGGQQRKQPPAIAVAAAAAAAWTPSPASNSVGIDLGNVTVAGVQYKKYPTPDTSTYQYDETSGYFYDPLSTLYYDANSQYYYNSKTSSFCYWDSAHSTFLPAPTTAKESTAAEEKKEKSGGKDKVKTAKKIQKDMEKWAKTLNQKKNAPFPAAARDISNAGPEVEHVPLQKGVEDIAFSILQRSEDKPSASNAAPAAGGYGSDEEADISLLELELTDWDKFACLLCKRQFTSKDKLMKHNTVSDLHKVNLQQWKDKQIEKRNSSLESALQYRDRAKERRSKFGGDDPPPPNKFKEKYMKVMDNIAANAGPDNTVTKIGDDNVGNKMLQRMGWKEGLGLGKANQGRTDIISTDDGRTNSAGLGIKQVSRRTNDDYRSAAKRMLWSRFNDGRDQLPDP